MQKVQTPNPAFAEMVHLRQCSFVCPEHCVFTERALVPCSIPTVCCDKLDQVMTSRPPHGSVKVARVHLGVVCKGCRLLRLPTSFQTLLRGDRPVNWKVICPVLCDQAVELSCL